MANLVDKIVAGWYERTPMRSALNGTGSISLYLIKAVFNSSSQFNRQ